MGEQVGTNRVVGGGAVMGIAHHCGGWGRLVVVVAGWLALEVAGADRSGLIRGLALSPMPSPS